MTLIVLSIFYSNPQSEVKRICQADQGTGLARQRFGGKQGKMCKDRKGKEKAVTLTMNTQIYQHVHKRNKRMQCPLPIKKIEIKKFRSALFVR